MAGSITFAQRTKKEDDVRRLNLVGMSGVGLAACCLIAGAAVAEEPSTVPKQATQQQATQQEGSMALAVHDNMDVSMEYTVSSDGAVVDSTEGKPPFHYTHGHGQIIPGLERQLAGMHVGDSKEVTVGPDDGYGQIDPAGLIEVPKEQLPKDVTPTAGMVLRGMNPDGKSFRAIIKEIKDKTVVLDLNHPLAGKTLTFKVKITGIAPTSGT